MSLANVAPDGFKNCECKRITFHEHPLVPFVPKKDIVQETVSALKNYQSLKTLIGEGTELRHPIFHCGVRKAFLMDVGSAMDAI
jgi:hypothetical protein